MKNNSEALIYSFLPDSRTAHAVHSRIIAPLWIFGSDRGNLSSSFENLLSEDTMVDIFHLKMGRSNCATRWRSGACGSLWLPARRMVGRSGEVETPGNAEASHDLRATSKLLIQAAVLRRSVRQRVPLDGDVAPFAFDVVVRGGAA